MVQPLNVRQITCKAYNKRYTKKKKRDQTRKRRIKLQEMKEL